MEVEKRQDSKYNVTNLDKKEEENLNLEEKIDENKRELEEEERKEEESEQKVESQVFSYDAPWLIYSLGFSSRPNT